MLLLDRFRLGSLGCFGDDRLFDLFVLLFLFLFRMSKILFFFEIVKWVILFVFLNCVVSDRFIFI